MTKVSPGQNMDKLEQTLNALETLAPEAKFGGLTLAQFKAKVQASADARSKLAETEATRLNDITARDNADEEAMNARTLVINGIVGDPDFGPDSALYEACGFVRKSERKSGLTRKTKSETSKSPIEK